MNLRFTINQEAFKRAVDHQSPTLFRELADADDKQFSVVLLGKEYHLRYTVSAQGVADIFLITDDTDAQLSLPMLRLNIGAFLLPESMSIHGQEQGLNPGVSNSEVPEYSLSGVTDSEKTALKQYIQAVGLKNLVTKYRNNSQK